MLSLPLPYSVVHVQNFLLPFIYDMNYYLLEDSSDAHRKKFASTGIQLRFWEEFCETEQIQPLEQGHFGDTFL